MKKGSLLKFLIIFAVVVSVASALFFGTKELLFDDDMHGFPMVSISTDDGHNYMGFPVGFDWENDDTPPSESLSGLWQFEFDESDPMSTGPVRATVPVTGETAELRITMIYPAGEKPLDIELRRFDDGWLGGGPDHTRTFADGAGVEWTREKSTLCINDVVPNQLYVLRTSWDEGWVEHAWHIVGEG